MPRILASRFAGCCAGAAVLNPTGWRSTPFQKRSAAWLAHGATRVERRACFPRRPLQTKKPVMKRAGEALKRLMRGCLAVGSAALLSAPPSHAFETADELYRACRMWQGTKLGGMTERMSRSDVLKAGLCAGYAQAWPAAYMLGAAAAAPAPSLRPNVPTPPGCFRPSRTSTGDVIMAIVRRYERDPLRMKTESPDLLTQLALREELPCAIR